MTAFEVSIAGCLFLAFSIPLRQARPQRLDVMIPRGHVLVLAVRSGLHTETVPVFFENLISDAVLPRRLR
jgi:hypothetical protein